MTNPDKIKNVLSNHEERCMDCWFHGVSGCNRLARSCKLFDAVQGALDYIDELETKALKWVSVKDRLPEHVRGNYLILLSGEIYAAKWEYDEWNEKYAFRINCQIVPNVTHWMKVPEPPEEEDYDGLS